MTKKKVYVVDKLVVGYNHVLFNTTITAILSNIYHNQTVMFVCESLHADVVSKKNAKYKNLQYKSYHDGPLPANVFKRLYPWIKKKITDVLFLNNLFKNTFIEAEAVFFTCLSTSSLLFAARLAKKIKIPVYFFVHGEVEYLFIKNDRLVNKIKGAMYRAFLNQIGKNVKVISLSKIVEKKLIECNILLPYQIISINHPVVPVNRRSQKIMSEKLILGHIGIATQKKSSEFFFELAKLQTLHIENGNVDFQLVGSIEQDLFGYDSSSVTVLAKGRKLTQDEYEEYLKKLSYAVFTFTGDNYVYRVSGTVIDAIANAIPIIALNHSYFDHLFSTAGNIGFLCQDVREMNFLIDGLIAKEPALLNQYDEQQSNLKLLRQQLDIKNIEQNFKKACLSQEECNDS